MNQPSTPRAFLRQSVRALLVAAACAAGAVHAGQACEEKAPDPQSVANGLALAASTAKALDASGATVALLARAGQDLSKYGLTYSHLGFAYRETVGGKPGWRILHKLNHCGTALSALYRQGLGEFFLDNPHRYEAAFVVLSPDLQARLLLLLKDNALVGVLNEAHYSMVAYAWAQTYQQSNQWAVETMAVAAEPGVVTRKQAQAWMQLKGYEPSTLKLGPLTRLGARATAANVAFDDHPSDKRFSDRIETVTVDSVFAWVQRSGLGATPVTVHAEPR
jgi:hypothetical protein